MNVAIILGSSRSKGNTYNKIQKLKEQTDWHLFDLNNYNFSYYDYEHLNKEDDFIPLMKKLMDYDVLIFATPVYWYSMSGIMKVFFDRLTDLITIEKELGRQFRGKYCAVLSCSNGGNLAEQFWLPFKESADYLGMNYIGNIHTYNEVDNKKELIEFRNMIMKAIKVA